MVIIFQKYKNYLFENCKIASFFAKMPKPCRFGDKCHNKTCKFGHPSKTQRPCRYGSNCANKAKCSFEHPSALNPDANAFVPHGEVPTVEEMNADMEELDMLIEMESFDPFARLDDGVEEDGDPNGDTVYYG